MSRKCFGLFLVLFVLLFTIVPVAAQQAGQTVYSTAQPFENGLMIWRSDTAYIWVLGNNGQVLNFPVSRYGGLPDNPVFGDPPGRLRPIFGFGKVWGNIVEVRGLLGWPTLPELGFNMGVRYANRTYFLTQLDGSVIQINPNDTWTRTAGDPPPSQARIVSFSASPEPVAPGGVLTLNWSIEGAQLALVEVYNQADNSLLFFLPDLTRTGSTAISVPANLNSNLRVTLWAANRAQPRGVLVSMYERLVQSTITVGVGGAPTGSVTQAAFQQYQRGFMIWRADTGGVYVFASDNARWAAFPQSTYEGLSDNTIVAPSGFVTSVNGFGRVWGNFQHIRDTLGWATGTEQGYQLSVSTRNGTAFASSLPDPNRTVTFDAAGNYTIVNFICGTTAGC